jgi:rhodanese-related sulfurtransferase
MFLVDVIGVQSRKFCRNRRDNREQFEWDSFHIPNSTHIPLGQLSQRLNELPTDREIVVVCRTGNRSQEGRDILQVAGWNQVTSMAGGVVDWQAAGYPIVSGP